MKWLPINEWSKKEIAIFALHHAVYAAVAGLVFDAINKKEIDEPQANSRKKKQKGKWNNC